jgi:hypothetical protein
MNDLYVFGGGVHGFQCAMDPVLESELRKCKTQKEKDEVIEAWQTTTVLGFVGSINSWGFGVWSDFTLHVR